MNEYIDVVQISYTQDNKLIGVYMMQKEAAKYWNKLELRVVYGMLHAKFGIFLAHLIVKIGVFRQINRRTDREQNRQWDRQIKRQRNKETDRQTDWEIGRWRNREAEEQGERRADGQKTPFVLLNKNIYTLWTLLRFLLTVQQSCAKSV